MGTMLSFITTDVNISKELLTKAFKEDIEDTYYMVSVDGDTSTNDKVLIFANDRMGNAEITLENEDYKVFATALHMVNETLCKKIAGGGEGLTALLEVTMKGAATKQQTVILAKSVVT